MFAELVFGAGEIKINKQKKKWRGVEKARERERER